jgi:hypothetical protein
MIFCGHCGYALFGQFNNKKKYYRHPQQRGCKNLSIIPADIIDDAVVAHLFETFGDRVKMEQAAKDAIPDLREAKLLKAQLRKNNKELEKINRAKNNLLDKVEKDIIEDEDLRDRFQRHKERENLIKSENETIQYKLSSIPTEREITLKTQLLLRTKQSYYFTEKHLNEMTFENKRELLQNIFSGTDTDGKRFGVYVEKKSKDVWIYQVKGVLIDEVGRLRVDRKKPEQIMRSTRVS